MTKKEVRTVEVTEAAKEIRKALKRNFKGTKFSVRTQKYAGGCHVTIEWEDGPREKEVEMVVQPFYSADFDGMTDSTTYHSTTLVDEDGNLEEVRFRGSSPELCRKYSEEAQTAAAEALARVAAKASYIIDGDVVKYACPDYLSKDYGLDVYASVVRPEESGDGSTYFEASDKKENSLTLIRQFLRNIAL